VAIKDHLFHTGGSFISTYYGDDPGILTRRELYCVRYDCVVG